MGRVAQQKYESEEDDSDKSDKEGNSEEEYDEDCPGSFYIRFKDGIPPLVKKDMMVEDLWILLKRPLISNQNLTDMSDIIFVKSCWHNNNK